MSGSVRWMVACAAAAVVTTPLAAKSAKPLRITVAPARLVAKQGSVATSQVQVSREEGATAVVTVKAPKLPGGMRMKPQRVTADQSAAELSLEVAPTTLPGGPFPIELRAAGGGAHGTATLSVRVLPGDATATWLDRMNAHRALGGLLPVVEEPEWSDGCFFHTRYMIKNHVGEHDEKKGNAWFTEAGLACAKSADLGLDYDLNARDEAGIDGLVAGPFHGVQILDPALTRSAFASYREKTKGAQMASAIDVIRGRGALPGTVKFPVTYPANGAAALVTTLSTGEWPASLPSCPGFVAPVGAPIFFMAGGSAAPSVSQSHVIVEGKEMRHCRFDEMSYVNPVAYDQQYGRDILALRHTIILLPEAPLPRGAKTTVWMTVGGKTTTWSFIAGGT